jgi:hypothetical protein
VPHNPRTISHIIQGCRVISTLAGSSAASQTKLVEYGACELVIKIVRTHGCSSPAVLEFAAMAIRSLSEIWNSDEVSLESQSRFDALDTYSLFIDILRTHGGGDAEIAAKVRSTVHTDIHTDVHTICSVNRSLN